MPHEPHDPKAVPELPPLRAQMDALNAELAAVLHRRAALVRRIVAVKRAHGLPVHDPDRERAMLAALPEPPADGFPRDAVARLFGVVFDESKRLVR